METRATLQLTVGAKHVKEWSDKKAAELIKSIFKELQIDPPMAKVTIDIKRREEIIVEFRAVCFDAPVNAGCLLTFLERRFLDLEIYKREFSYEER